MLCPPAPWILHVPTPEDAAEMARTIRRNTGCQPGPGPGYRPIPAAGYYGYEGDCLLALHSIVFADNPEDAYAAAEDLVAAATHLRNNITA